MKGLGIKAQLGRTALYLRLWPFYLETERTYIEPVQFGFGVWVTRDTRSLPGSTYSTRPAARSPRP